MLSAPQDGFAGGELILVEQRPRKVYVATIVQRCATALAGLPLAIAVR